MSSLEMMIRTFVGFIVLFLWSRILGKKLISQMTFFDFVAGITLGTITGSVMFTANVPLMVGLLGLSLFSLLALSLGVITLKSYGARKMINSHPTLIIKEGKILEEAMEKTRLTMDDLLFLLREKNIFYVDDVELAYLETNGKVSALKKPEVMAVTRKDMNLFAASRGLPRAFIIDGKVIEESLNAMNKDMEWVHNILQSQGISSIGNVAFAQIDQQEKVYLDTRQDGVSPLH